MTNSLTRRKFVTISAAAAGLGLSSFGVARGKERAHLIEWQGISLGAVATIRLYHSDRAAGQSLINRVIAESRRLEMIFTLYQAESVLCDLNRRGVLVGATSWWCGFVACAGLTLAGWRVLLALPE